MDWFLFCLSSLLQAKQMNIFLLDADEWRHDTLGLAGNPIVKTPSLDALAGEGGRFIESCVTTAICGVSRVNLYTGKWMSGHGCRGFKMFNMPMSQTYSSLFRKEDYFVEHAGKWHNGKIPAKELDYSRLYFGRHFVIRSMVKGSMSLKGAKWIRPSS